MTGYLNPVKLAELIMYRVRKKLLKTIMQLHILVHVPQILL